METAVSNHQPLGSTSNIFQKKKVYGASVLDGGPNEGCYYNRNWRLIFESKARMVTPKE
jgi:hypothetical protein